MTPYLVFTAYIAGKTLVVYVAPLAALGVAALVIVHAVQALIGD